MRTATNKLIGINRATPLHNAGNGSLYECINLRYKDDALRLVGKKKTTINNFQYDDFIIHKDRLIAVVVTTEDTYVDYINSASGVLIQRIKGDLSSNVELHTIGNTLVILDKSQNAIFTYLFNNNNYEIQFDGFPHIVELQRVFQIAREHTKDVDSSVFSPSFSTPATDLEKKQFEDNLLSAISEVKSKEAEYDEGYILVSTSYTLIDNTEIKCSNPMMFEIGKAPALYENGPLDEFPHIFYYKDGGCCARVNLGTIYIKLLNLEFFLNQFKHIVKSVNVYASTPVSHYELTRENINTNYYLYEEDDILIGGGHPLPENRVRSISIKANKLKNELFERVLMFRQCSITLADKDKLNKEFVLKFDADQTTNATMQVENSSMFNTCGDGFIYNNRLHLYNYKRSFINDIEIYRKMGATEVNTTEGSIYRRTVDVAINSVSISVLNDCFIKVYIKTTSKDLILTGICKGNFLKYNELYYLQLQRFIAFPDSRAYKIEIYTTHDHVNYKGTINLNPSLAYNYAYYVNSEISASGLSCLMNVTEEIVNVNNIYSFVDNEYREEDIVLVSAQNNAFFFPIEHSYRMPSKILSMNIQGYQIADSATGRYPLFVMTDRGIYALEQGDGKVLYSNNTHINSDTCSTSVQTSVGIAYITNDKRIMLLVGRDSICISEQLKESTSGPKHRNCAQYPLTCNNPLLYEIQPYLSSISIETYLDNAILLYDRNNSEIIVSNIAYKYSYVYSIQTKVWHTITEVFKPSHISNYAMIINDDRRNVCLLDTEVKADNIAHIESREMIFDSSSFKALQRMLIRAHIKAAGINTLGAYLYASNDGVSFQMINLFQFQNETSNILLNKCLNSYRFFVLQIGGKVEEITLSHIESVVSDRATINLR